MAQTTKRENILESGGTEENEEVFSKKRRTENDLAEATKKRRSEERRAKAKFLGICMSCQQYAVATTGEVASYAYEHMCDPTHPTDHEGLKKCIEILQNELELSTTKKKCASTLTSMAMPPPRKVPPLVPVVKTSKGTLPVQPSPPIPVIFCCLKNCIHFYDSPFLSGQKW